MAAPSSGTNWPAYYAATAGAPPRPTLLHALERFDREPPTRRRRFAVDLGCGVGRDTLELLRRRWRVLAVDAEPAAVESLLRRAERCQRRYLSARIASMEQVAWPQADLVNASFALPFCSPLKFASVWSEIVRSLRVGGRFAGQFFGERDEWASLPDRTHHSRAAVNALLRGFEIELLQEAEFDGHTARGDPHHWHVFHVVGRRVSSAARG